MSQFFSKIDESNKSALKTSIREKLIENNYQNDPDDLAEYILMFIGTSDVTKEDVFNELKEIIDNLQFSFIDWLYEENENFANNDTIYDNDISMKMDDNTVEDVVDPIEGNNKRKRDFDDSNQNQKTIIKPISSFENDDIQPNKKAKKSDDFSDNKTKKIIRPISPFDESRTSKTVDDTKKKSKFVTIRNSANDDVDEDEILRKRRLRFQNELPPEKSNHNKNQNNKNQNNKIQHNKNQKNNNNHSKKEHESNNNNNNHNNNNHNDKNNNKQMEIQIAKIHKKKMNGEGKNDNSSNKHERHSTNSRDHNNSGNHGKSNEKSQHKNQQTNENKNQSQNNLNNQNNNNNGNNNFNNNNNTTNNNNNNIDPEQMEEKPVRCVFWPNCAKQDECKFWHPKELCKKFPNCPDNDKCLYIHPQVPVTANYSKVNPYMSFPTTMPLTSQATIAIPCKYGIHCAKANCPYLHSTPVVVPGVDPTKMEDTRSLIPCRFYPNCLNANCPFYHPPLPGKTSTKPGTEGTNAETGSAENGKTVTAEPILKPIPNFSAVYDINKSKIPCRYEPYCSRPDCPYMHTINKQLNAEKHISERGFALDVETEKVIPNSGIDQDTSKLSNSNEEIVNEDSLQNEVTDNVDIPSEAMIDAEEDTTSVNQVELNSSVVMSNIDSQENFDDGALLNETN